MFDTLEQFLPGTLTPLEASEFMKGAIPNAELVVLSPAKHLGLLEDDTQFANTLIDFCVRGRLAYQTVSNLSNLQPI